MLEYLRQLPLSPFTNWTSAVTAGTFVAHSHIFFVFFSPSTIYFIFSHNSFYLFVLQLLHQLLLRHVLQQSPTNCSKSIVKKGLSLGITSAWQLTFSCRRYCHQSDHFSYFSGNLLIRMTLICVHFNKLSRGCKHNKECGSNNEYCLTVLTVITSNCMMEMGLRFLLDMDGIPRPLTWLCSKCPLENLKISAYKSLWLTHRAMSKLITACWSNRWH